jgi:hypothetical protein
MTLRLFDVQCGFGGAKPGHQPVTADELLTAMDRLQVDRALVRLTPDDLDGDAPASNELLFAAAKDDARLVPCPVALPADCGDVPEEDRQVASLVARGAGAVCVRPALDCWSLSPWASGRLFAALAERRLPVLCMQKQVSLDDVARLAAAHPQLPLIVAEGQYRQLRVLLPLLEAFANVHLSIGSNFCVHDGVERLVEKVGPERLLFGTGLPEVEPMMAVTLLAYSGLGGREKRLIGAENLERLNAGVRR